MQTRATEWATMYDGCEFEPLGGAPCGGHRAIGCSRIQHTYVFGHLHMFVGPNCYAWQPAHVRRQVSLNWPRHRSTIHPAAITLDLYRLDIDRDGFGHVCCAVRCVARRAVLRGGVCYVVWHSMEWPVWLCLVGRVDVLRGRRTCPPVLGHGARSDRTNMILSV